MHYTVMHKYIREYRPGPGHHFFKRSGHPEPVVNILVISCFIQVGKAVYNEERIEKCRKVSPVLPVTGQ